MPPPPTAARALLRRMGLGRLLYLLWHAPLSGLHHSLREGGPLARRRVRAGMLAMEDSAAALKPLDASPGTGPTLRPHLLTGARFWYQTAYCLQSLAHHADRRVCPVIHDDGTLTDVQAGHLTRLFPGTTLISHAEFLPRLEELLPVARFPALRERWLAYPHIRKLINVHLGSQGWKLVLDSDLLFFRNPRLLVDWCDAPDRPLHATDCTESYGYSRPLMQELCGHPLGDRVNVGLCGLRSEEIDWERLETWTATLIARESTHYYLEQALTAMLCAGRSCLQAPEQDYLTLPSRTEAHAPTAAMHHYVDRSKRWYFTHCWRHCLGNTGHQTPH